MDKKTEELLKKCENVEDTSIMGTCKGLLKMMAEKDVVVEDKEGQTYLDMAENMFPVIEVDAARKIEVIVTRGASLSLATSQGGGARR